MSQQAQNDGISTQSLSKKPSIRRRSERSHQAILKAAAELLEEKGYAGATVEAIAARAGVGKQTIYRWWSSKAAVIMEAYTAQAARNVPMPDTGSSAKDLRQLLRQLFKVLTTTTAGIAVSGLIAESQMDPGVAQEFREQFVASRRAVTYTILERGIDRGELRPNLNLDFVIDTIYGPVWLRLLLKHAPLDDLFAEELVKQLMSGIASNS